MEALDWEIVDSKEHFDLFCRKVGANIDSFDSLKLHSPELIKFVRGVQSQEGKIFVVLERVQKSHGVFKLGPVCCQNQVAGCGDELEHLFYQVQIRDD